VEPRGCEHGGISSLCTALYLTASNIVLLLKSITFLARELFEDDDTNLEIDRLNLVQLLERL
jgi:hypothetical protein